MSFRKKVSATPAPKETVAAAVLPPSFLSADLEVVGTIASTGTVVADGRIHGSCYAAQFTVGENGYVEGDVTASEIAVRGHVEGDLRAVKVQVRANGAVDGNICYRTLSVEAGGLLNGNCRHSDDPLAGMAEQAGKQIASLTAGTSP